MRLYTCVLSVNAGRVSEAGATSELCTVPGACSSNCSSSQAPATQRPRVVAQSTAFTVPLNDDDDAGGLRLHDSLGRFLPIALQQRSRAVTRRRDVTNPAPSATVTLETTEDADDDTPTDNDHVTRRECRGDSANNDHSALSTTTGADVNDQTTRDNDVTVDKDDVVSEAGTYTVDSGDDEHRRARRDIDDTVRVSSTSASASGMSRLLQEDHQSARVNIL